MACAGRDEGGERFCDGAGKSDVLKVYKERPYTCSYDSLNKVNVMNAMRHAYKKGYNDAINNHDKDIGGIEHSWLVDEYDLGYVDGLQAASHADERARQIEWNAPNA